MLEVNKIGVCEYKETKFSEWKKGICFNGGSRGVFDLTGRILYDYPYACRILGEVRVEELEGPRVGIEITDG